LTQPGFAVDTRDSKGMTALHIAAAAGKSDAVALLLARGADPAAYDSNGWTALHHAVREGHEGTVAALLNDEKSPANVNAQTRESGETPLHLAARKGHCDIIDALLAKGADAALLSGAGHVPLHHAIFGGRPLAGEKLLNALQRQKVNINKLRDRTGNSLLHFAAARAHEDLPKLLIAAGADVNAENKDGATPLHFACAAGRNETVLYLAVEKEALHKADKMGRTPASIAKEKGFTEILDLFEAMKAANDNENEKNAQLKNAKKPKKPSP
jgi:ankyrin repeat protein